MRSSIVRSLPPEGGSHEYLYKDDFRLNAEATNTFTVRLPPEGGSHEYLYKYDFRLNAEP